MTEQYISFSNLIQQLGQKDIETAQMVAAAFSSAFGFASGATPYAPVTPTFPKAPSGGGGSGGGTSPEKARIDSQIKSLERKRDAIKDNVDAMKDHIDAQKEALRLQKEEADFLDEIKKKNESLSDIKAEITLLSLDDSEEARAKRLKLEEEAAKLEEEIAEDNADRKYELQVDALEEFQREYEASMEKQMDALDKQIDKLREQSGAISSAGGAASGYADTWQQVGQVQDSVAQSIIDSLKGIGDATDEQRGRVKEYIIELMRAGDSADTVARKAQQALNLMMGVFSLDKAYAQKEDFLLSGKKYHDGGIVEKHHDGGFAGGLKSNEVFSKLLEGEYVATENQMDNFLTKTLPSMIGISPDVIKNFEGDGDVTISMPINIEGNVDDRTLPKIKSITDDVLREINKTLMSKGKIRDAKRYSI
jgi:predicted  nucleic acid-binding Zn-ribbon protein